MNAAPNDVRAGFLERYFRWALARWEEELESDYPMLRAFEGFSSAALVAMECFQRLDPGARPAMARALVKRAHKDVIELCQEAPLSPAEEVLLTRWLEMSRDVRFGRAFHLENYSIKRRLLKEALEHAITGIIGEPTLSSSRGGLGYVRRLGRWSIATDIDLGGRNHQMSYFHVVSWDSRLVRSGIGPLEWLGVSTTALDRVSAGQEEAAAMCVVRLMARFASSWQALMPQ